MFIDLGEQVCYALAGNTMYSWGRIRPRASIIETFGTPYVEKDPEFNPVSICCCPWTTFGIDSSGTIKGWGLNVYGLLDIPADIVVSSVSSYSNKTVVAIAEDKSVIAWGNSGANSWVMNQIPPTFRAKEIKLYDTFCIAVNTGGLISTWGIDSIDVSDFNSVKSVASCGSGNTLIAHLESGLLKTWHKTDFTGDVLPEDLVGTVVDFVDGYGEHYVAVANGKLYCWTYNADGEFVYVTWPEVNKDVKSVRLRTIETEYGSVPSVGVIYTNDKVGVFAATTLIEKSMLRLPPEIAYNEKSVSDCSQFLPLLLRDCLIKQLATGVGFSLALKKDNTVVGWGSEAGGVLDCTKELCKYVAAGTGCAAAIKLDNTMVTWGTGLSMDGLEMVKMKKIVLRCGPGVGLALGMDGQVHVFGSNAAEMAKIAVPEGLIAYDIDCNTVDGESWVVAINEERNAVQWGSRASLPDFTPLEKWSAFFDCDHVEEDVKSAFLANPTIPANAKRVAVGKYAAFVLNEDGSVYAWGENRIGELDVPEGLVASDLRAGESVFAMVNVKPYVKRWGPALAETSVMADLEPEQKAVAGADFKNPIYIEYGGNHIGAVNSEGVIRLWGPNRFNECKPLDLLKPFAKASPLLFGAFIGLASNPYYCCGLKTDGKVVVWGGKNVNNPRARFNNLPPPGLNNVKQICSAGSMWFALLEDGTVKYWNVTTPSKLVGLDNAEHRYECISTNNNVALGIVQGSRIVVGFGENGYGIKKHIVPSLKTGGCKYIYAGPNCAMAVDSDDRLVMWGTKYDVALRPPADLGPVLKAACSGFLVVAIMLDGSLRSWGKPEAASVVDACPSGLFKEVSICRASCIGIRQDGTVVEWGAELLGNDLAWPPGIKAISCTSSGSNGFNAIIDSNGRILVRGGNDTVEQRYPERSVLIPGGVPGILLDPVGLFEEKSNSSVQHIVRSEPDYVSAVAACNNILGIVKNDGSLVIWQNSENLHFVPRHLLGVDLFAIGPYNCICRNGVGKYFVWGQTNMISLLPETLDALQIVIGTEAALALQNDGKLLIWGSDLPADLVTKEFRAIACNGLRFAAVDDDGIIHMWGHADQPATYVASVGATSISIGKNHYVAILEDNSVICWGVSNQYKQLDMPTGLRGTKAVCGQHFTVVLTTENKCVAWGWPKACVQIPDVTVTDFACGNDFVLAKLEDSSYALWGQDVTLGPAESFINPSEILNSITKEQFRKPGKIVSELIMNRRGLKELQMNDKVYDMRLGKERKLTSFLLQNQGNAVVFRHKGIQTGLLKSDLRDDILLEDSKQDVYRKGIFYECRRMAQQSDPSGGEFTLSDVYSEPYLLLSLINGRYLIGFSDAERIFKQNQFWIVKDAGYSLPLSTSYWGVVIGQPVSSMVHCQEGSDQPVYILEPYEFFDDDEDEEEEEEPDYVFIQLVGTEAREKISIADSKKCLDVKQKYAVLKGLEVGQIRLFSGGKVMGDSDVLTGGFVFLAKISSV